MNYNFDKIIDRKGTNAMSLLGFREYLFGETEGLNLPCSDDELISMWIADMEFATAPPIVEALQKRVAHPIYGYTQLFDPAYKNAFLNWVKTRYDWRFDLDHLLISKGIIPALFNLIGYICKADEKVMIVTPSYAFFKHGADYNGVELVTSDLMITDGKYELDFDDLRQKAEDEKVRLCIFCNPHNPTGRVWETEELRTLGQICLDNNVLIISDEVHCDLLRTGVDFTPLAKLFPDTDQIITCMSPSKTFNLAGFSFANIIIPNEALRTKWLERHLPIENPLSIVAAKAAYESGSDWLEDLKKYLDENFIFLEAYLKKHLPNALFKIPGSTYLAWINVGSYLPEEENLTLFFANRAGVLLEGGNMFVSNSDGYIRLNLACPRSRLKEGLDRIVKALL